MFLYVRLLFQPPPPLDNYCAVPNGQQYILGTISRQLSGTPVGLKILYKINEIKKQLLSVP